MTRLEQQIRFITEIDKVKNIFRQTYLADGKRKRGTMRNIPGILRPDGIFASGNTRKSR